MKKRGAAEDCAKNRLQEENHVKGIIQEKGRFKEGVTQEKSRLKEEVTQEKERVKVRMQEEGGLHSGVKEEKRVKSVPSDYHIFPFNAEERLKFIAGAGAAVFVTAFLFYHSFFISCCLTSCVIWLVRPYEKHRAVKRRTLLGYQFKDALYTISASVAAGRQLPEALQDGGHSMELLYGEDALITMELKHVSGRILDLKEPEEHVLVDWARRTGLPDIASFVDVYSVCRATGGDVEKVLAKTARLIMERIDTEKEIQVGIAQKRLEMRILTLMPLTALLLMQLTSREYIAVLYETIIGRLVMTAAAAAMAVSYVLSRKITDISV